MILYSCCEAFLAISASFLTTNTGNKGQPAETTPCGTEVHLGRGKAVRFPEAGQKKSCLVPL